MRLVAWFVVFIFAASGCTNSSTHSSTHSSTSKEVVATIFPIYDAASAVGGKRLHVVNLLPLDPFAPLTIAKADRLRNASIAIVLGKGIQPEVDRVLATRNGPVIRVLDSIGTKSPADGDSMSNLSLDPRVWLDPANQENIVEQVKTAFTSFDAGGRKLYVKNAANIHKTLVRLDRKLAATISTCKYRDVITTQADYQYLTARYGLNQVVVSAEQLANVITQYKPNTVYFSDLPSLDQAQNYKSKYGIRVSTLDPLVVQTDQARRGGASYANVMELNLAALREGLDCKKVSIPR